MSEAPKRVLVMLNARKFLDVVVRYALEHNWLLTLMNDGLAPHGWTGDGALFSYSRSVQQKNFVRHFDVARTPAVALSYSAPSFRVPRVVVDFGAISRLGAQHLRARAYRSYAFLSTERLSSCALCHAAYAEELRRLGENASPPWFVWNEAIPEARLYDWPFVTRIVRGLIEPLPKPLAVFCLSDSVAIGLLNAVLALGYRVPEDIGILGVNDNPLFCETQRVPLSSINPDFNALARTACERLDAAMEGRALSLEPEFLPPRGLSLRASTGLPLVSEPLLAEAMRFMRAHLTESFGMGQLATALGVSESTLARLFREKAKTTPAAELRRLRLEKAQGLLRLTELKLEAIARACGFPHAAHFTNVFRATFGETPTRWRQLWR